MSQWQPCKRILTGMLSGLLFIFPMVCSAAWKIHLKDGRNFTTPEYREEGDQIKFERYGGLIGLPRDQVMDIEEIEDVPGEEVLKPPKEPPVPENGKERTPVSETPSASAEAKGEKSADQKEADPQLVFMGEKRQILAERENVSQAFRAAKKAKDDAKKDALWQELFNLRERLQNLQNRVTVENNGVLPPWWDQIE